MATHNLTIPLLVGNGVPIADAASAVQDSVVKTATEVAPAYDFQRSDGTVNWAIVRTIVNSEASVLITGLEDADSNGDDVVWRIRVHFLNRADGMVGDKLILFKFRAGAPTEVIYGDKVNLIEVESLPRPDYVEAALGVATAEAIRSEAAAEDAAAAAASVQRNEPGGVAGLTAGGKLYEAQVPDRLSASGLSATIVDGVGYAPGFDIAIGWGQSNWAGRGLPYSSTLDPVNPRIFQWGTHGTLGIKPATEPMDTHEGIASGIGPMLQFGRWYAARRLAPTRKLLLVNTAHGGTPLSSNASPLGWRRGVAGNLYENMITQALAALAAANAIPGTVNRIILLAGLQGETDGDNNVTATQYRTDLDANLNGVRTDLGIPDLPIVVGTMVPEYLATGTRGVINMVHRDTPNRIARTDVAVSAVGMNKGDGNHFSGAGSRFNGKAIFDAYERIAEGIAPYAEGLPVDFGPVVGLTASSPANSFSQPLSWTALSGATSYLVEYKEHASSTWLTAGTTSGTAFTVGGLYPVKSYDYRISPVNGSGTGYASAAVTATTIPETAVVTDTFNRADNASTLGSADTGQAWSAITGTFAIGANRGYHGSTANSLAEVDAGVANCIARIKFVVLGTGATALDRLVFRGDGTTSNYWMVQYRQSSNAYQIYKNVAGTFTQIGANITATTPASGDVLEVSMQGSTITVRINGAVVSNITDSDLATNTRHGFGGTGNVGRYDDFAVVV